MIFLEIIVGALMAVILLFVGHTLGEEKADREIITKFNSLRGQLRKEIIEELKREGQENIERLRTERPKTLKELKGEK